MCLGSFLGLYDFWDDSEAFVPMAQLVIVNQDGSREVIQMQCQL